MATELIFMQMGYRRPTSHKSIVDILNEIDQIAMENAVLVDLRGCVFSYPLARIVEKVVDKIKDIPGVKKIKIIHGYATATDNHLLPYLIKKVNYIDSNISSLDEMKRALLDKYEIELNISNA